jgi:hypothetical protein
VSVTVRAEHDMLGTRDRAGISPPRWCAGRAPTRRATSESGPPGEELSEEEVSEYVRERIAATSARQSSGSWRSCQRDRPESC